MGVPREVPRRLIHGASTSDERFDIGAGADVAEAAVDGVQGGVEVVVGRGGVGVGDHDGAVAEDARVSCGGLAADVGDGSGDEHGVDASVVELVVEVAAAGEERARCGLVDVQVVAVAGEVRREPGAGRAAASRVLKFG